MSLMLCASVAAADDCRLERVAAVDMTLAKDGGLQIPVEINGVRFKMAINAGSGLSAIWSGAVAPLNLRPKEIAGSTLVAGGKPLTRTVKINALKIGDVRWAPFDAVVYPVDKVVYPSLSDDDVVGFLGQEVFAKLDLELDFGAKQLRLYSQKHCPGRVVYWASQYDIFPLEKNALGNLYISMAINGRLISTSMSTTSPISTIEQEAASRIGINSVGDEANSSSDGCSNCRAITLKAQGLEIRNARVSVVNTVSKDCQLNVPRSLEAVVTYECVGAFPLKLGINVLSQLHLYYANAEKKLYFTSAGADMGRPSVQPTRQPASQP